jgi:hypothetical protein
MTDTPDYIYKKQFEIFFLKSLKERFLMNLELSEFVRETTRRRIKRQNPVIEDIEIKKEIFKQTYSDVFSIQQMNDIFETWDKIHKSN